MIEKEDWFRLLQLDELNRELAAGRVLCGFKALQPNFPPTFKRVQNMAIPHANSLTGRSSPRSNNKNFLVFSDRNSDLGVAVNLKTLSYYRDNRLPSYTDRILYKSLPGFRHHLEVNAFESCEDVLISDHKPVRASFNLQTTPGPAGIVINKDGIGSFELRLSQLRVLY